MLPRLSLLGYVPFTCCSAPVAPLWGSCEKQQAERSPRVLTYKFKEDAPCPGMRCAPKRHRRACGSWRLSDAATPPDDDAFADHPLPGATHPQLLVSLTSLTVSHLLSSKPNGRDHRSCCGFCVPLDRSPDRAWAHRRDLLEIPESCLPIATEGVDASALRQKRKWPARRVQGPPGAEKKDPPGGRTASLAGSSSQRGRGHARPALERSPKGPILAASGRSRPPAPGARGPSPGALG